jgi:colicin import membrane protein
MNSTLQRRDPWFGWMFLSSLVIHLACYILLVTFHFNSLPLAEGPVYYVDVVTLPVANPRSGTPSTSGGAPPVPAHEEMAVPAPAPRKVVTKPKTPVGKKPATPAETARQFEERMAKIEQDVAAKHTSAALEALQKKVAGSGKGGRTGIPGGKGMEAGSDYAGYIRSRLTDAFRTTIAFQTKNPEVMVRLTIDRTGKVSALKLERSSNDRIFEDAVINAIVKAEQTFVPPPGGGKFEYSFRFAPEGVSKK